MKKILLVFGTRPEAIKMIPVFRALKDKKFFDTRICITAQHREMLDSVLELFGVKADYDLDIMKSGQDLFDITAAILKGMKTVLDDFEPDLVLVHGDTSTTFAASLAAFYKQIKVGHVEAGLRTGSIYSPWPEEANRRMTTRLAEYHFAPTAQNRQNLIAEGVSDSDISVTGNTVIDSLLAVAGNINSDYGKRVWLKEKIISYGFTGFADYSPESNSCKSRYILVTGHRRESFGEGFRSICLALKKIAYANKDIKIVYPVHMNPNVRTPVNELLRGIENIYLIEPLQYEEFIMLLSMSYIVLTDSGGIQEEAPALGKPVLVMRETTERIEAVDAGTVKLVGTDTDIICSEVQKFIDSKDYYDRVSVVRNPYGEGNAAGVIADFLVSCFSGEHNE
ncbi:MAG: non-hydrolyzing UDP-N-acetylglucosamine 2-epimerase [Deferribacterales bacterium]